MTFGFSLSKRQGNYLRGLLASGRPVVLKATVAARLFAGHMDVVTATIRGRTKPNEEVFLVAHLCHPQPSANDNASGSGLLLEVARTIQTLIASRRIPRPRRTIRFLWVPETLGTTAYLYHHEKEARRLVAGINLDMVGENQELCRSTLNLDRTPDSNPSYLNDFVWTLMERSVGVFDPLTAFGSASTFRYRVSAFSGGSDHVEFNESTIGAPCVMLLQWPDLYYHSSLDTMDKVSEDSLRRVGWITTMAAVTLADATATDAVWLAHLATLGGIARLDAVSRDAVTTLYAKKRHSPSELAKLRFTVRNRMDHAVWRDTQAVSSVRRLGASAALDAVLTAYVGDLKHHGALVTQRFEELMGGKAGKAKVPRMKESAAVKEARRLKPRRRFKGALSDDALKRA